MEAFSEKQIYRQRDERFEAGLKELLNKAQNP
jgi:hypothetical protein